MQVRDIMNKNVIVGKKDITIKEASEVMSKLRIGSLVITEGKNIIGIITSTDRMTNHLKPPWWKT